MRPAAWLVAGALVAAVAGCKRGDEPCVVTGVTVEEDPGPSRLQAAGLTRDDLRAIALEAFGRAPGFVVPVGEPPRGAPRCRGAVALLDGRLTAGSGQPRSEVALRMKLSTGDDTDDFVETARGSDTLERGEPVAASVRRAIRNAADRGARQLALALAESRKPDAEVIRDLESADPKLRELAVGVLADRKNPAAVPGLLQRLQDPDPVIASRAVGALAQIGDPRAVGPIIELSRRREGPFVAQMVRAVGDIGGAEAEAYLETLVAGHSDPLVVQAAREALEDARRKARASAAKGPAR